MAVSTVHAKIISLLVLLVATIVAVLVPVRLHAVVSRSGGQVALRLLSSASGDALLLLGQVPLLYAFYHRWSDLWHCSPSPYAGHCRDFQ